MIVLIRDVLQYFVVLQDYRSDIVRVVNPFEVRDDDRRWKMPEIHDVQQFLKLLFTYPYDTHSVGSYTSKRVQQALQFPAVPKNPALPTGLRGTRAAETCS